LFGLLTLGALSASAADEEAPSVVGPADRPGADVVWEGYVEYTLDSTGSSDAVGIVEYSWNITAPDTTNVLLTSTTPTLKWTPPEYGIYKIVAGAKDAAGNMGYYLFTMDAYEAMSAQLIQDTTVSYTHSVAVDTGQLTFTNTDIDVSGGLASEAVASVDAPDQLAESLTNTGKFAGEWKPYYSYYNYAQYGSVYEDSSTKLSGSKSIRVTEAQYLYGMEYWFDNPVDLTEYEALSFWFHSDKLPYSTYYDYYYMQYLYVYGNQNYQQPYGYLRSGTMYQGGASVKSGWHGYTMSLDAEKSGYTYFYGMTDLSSISILRFYMYIYTTGTTLDDSLWIDNVGFYNPTWGDEITESANPTGDKAGYWSSSWGTGTSYGDSFTGSNSVRARIRYQQYNNIYYYFNTAQDLSDYNALRFQLNMKTAGGQQINYAYYWPYSNRYNLYVYDDSGHQAYFMPYRNTYIYYGYGTTNGGKWFGHSMAWGPDTAYYDNGVDWSKITYFRFANIYYSYSYPMDSPAVYADMYIDALEWYKPGGPSGGSGPPVNQEDIPCGIYVGSGGTLSMTGVSFTSSSPFGAFVRSEGTMSIKSSSFDGLWGTTHDTIDNNGQTYGGILAFDSDVTLDGVTITKASSSGFYLENCNLDAKNLDVSRHSAGYAESAGLIVAFTDTAIGETHTVSVKASDFYDSDMGSGMMILAKNARGNADVTLDDVYLWKNQVYGVVMEIVGWTGNLSVDVMNSEFELNAGSGFTFDAHDTLATPKTRIVFDITNCEAVENGVYGFLFKTKKCDVRATGTLSDIETYDNTGNGIGFEIGSFSGELILNFENIYSHENRGNGMYIITKQTNFRDFQGNDRAASGKLRINLDDSQFSSNEANGIIEYHSPSGSYTEAEHPTNDYQVIANNLIVEKNEGYGYYVSPDGQPQYGNRDAVYEFYDSVFSDNKNSGFYFQQYYYAYYYYGSYAVEEYLFDNCTFTYNRVGLQQYQINYGYGMESKITIRDCTFQDNDREAIYAFGEQYSYAMNCEWDVQDSLLDGQVYLNLQGFYDQGQGKTTFAKMTFINDTYTSDMPMFLRAASYYYTQSSFEGTVVYKNVKHTSPSNTHGIVVELYGGRILNARIQIEDQTIADAFGHGLLIRLGTLYTSTLTKSVTGRVDMVNLNIKNVMDDAIRIETRHSSQTGASSTGFFSLLDSKINGAGTGFAAADFSGEIRRTSFTNIREDTIHTVAGVIDVFESVIGPISEANLQVVDSGAIRLWFELRVKVVWRDDPDTPVTGTTVEIKDNSWTILGVNTIDDIDGLLFRNLNSYTVLPEGIYTKNPYTVTADYIGIVEELRVQLKATMEVTIKLVDDVAPRLTIESPKDGTEQRQQEVTVKGTSYDKHTGIDRVEISTDGENWIEAELSDDKFTYESELTDLDQGLVLIQVRVFDEAGNVKESAVSILVDSTPPNLAVITPESGMITNLRFLEIVGTTDVGAKVYINDQPVETRYTLISHTLVLAEGPNAIKVAAVDYLGNVNEIIRYVTLDTQAPYVAITNMEDGTQVNSAEITLIGETETEDVTITIGGEEVKVKDGKFSAIVTLVEGINDIEIYAVDTVGNDRFTYLRVLLDQTAPWLRITSPTEEVLTMKDFMVAGYVEQGSRVFVNDREVTVSYGYFETSVSAPEGPFDVTITSQDEAGNEMVNTVPLLIDTIAPSMEITYPMEGFVTNEPTIDVMGTILGTQFEDARYLELYINNIPRLFDYTSGEFSQEIILEEGVNRIQVMGMDTAGNSASMVRTVMLDSEAPYLSVFIGNVRNDPNWNEPVSLSDFVYVSGFTEIGVVLNIDRVSVDVDPETGYFNYTLALAKPLPGLKISTKDIDVTSTDGAGNSVTLTETVNRIEGASTTSEDTTSTAEWLILFLALVIFGMALAGAYGYNRIQSQEELIEAYESSPGPARVTADGKTITPPPARPARGGRARKPTAPEPVDEDEVVIHVDDDEEV
jgi:hypothetical protein